MIRNLKTPNWNPVVDMEVFRRFAFTASEPISGKSGVPISGPVNPIRLFRLQSTAPTWVFAPELMFRLPQPHTPRGTKYQVAVKICCGSGKLTATPIALSRNAIRPSWILLPNFTRTGALEGTVFCEPGFGLEYDTTGLAFSFRQPLSPPVKQIAWSRTKLRIWPTVKYVKFLSAMKASIHLVTSMVFGTHVKQYAEFPNVSQEINYDYCKIAEQRLAQEVLNL